MHTYQTKMKEILDAIAKEYAKDIVAKEGVLINGNSNDRNDLVVYTSHEGYNDFKRKVNENGEQ